MSNWGIVYNSSDENIETIFDLEGKKVATLKKGIHTTAILNLVQKFDISVEFIKLDTNHDVLRYVDNKQADAGIVNRIFALTEANKYKITKTPIVFNPIEIRYASPKGRNLDLLMSIDTHLKQLKEDNNSIYFGIFNNTFSPKNGFVDLKWVWRSLGGLGVTLVIVIIGFIVWNWTLRKKVAEATGALRESEELLHTVYDMTPVALAVTRQSDSMILLSNSMAPEMMGVDKEEYVGSKASAFYSDPEGRQRILEMLREEGSVRNLEFRTKKADGRPFWVSVNLRSIIYKNEPAMAAAWVDVTDSKKAETALLEAKEQAEFANRSKTEFLANMSHELRTPLTIINGNSEVLSTEMFGPIDNPKYLEYAKNIQEAGEHLLGLITDILDVSRIEMDRLELNEEDLDVDAVISSCHTLIKGRAHEEGLELGLEIEEGLPVLRGEELRIKQVVLNLLSNAIKFTPKGGTVTLKAATDEDGRVMFSVTDTGIGIAAEDQTRVMDTFGQVEGAYSRQFQGAGIGLPLSKKLVELHGGTLELDSELGVGTTVTARFPLERVIK
jgi:PAS domain S-box-containing protein